MNSPRHSGRQKRMTLTMTKTGLYAARSEMYAIAEPMKNCWRSFAVALTALALYLVLGPVPEALILDRSISLLAEPWRLVTAHLTHSDRGHLFWDCAGLLLVSWLYEPLFGQRVWLVLLAGSLAIDSAILTLAPEVLRYCGLSGLVNSIVGAGLVLAWMERRDPLLVGFGLLIAAKVVIENLTATPLFTDISWPPLHLAHLIGLLTGILMGTLIVWRKTRSHPQPCRPMNRAGKSFCRRIRVSLSR